MGSFGSGSTTTTSSNSEPWSSVQPYLEGNYQNASDLASAGAVYEPYTGSLVTPFANQTQYGLDLQQNWAESQAYGGALSNYAHDALNSQGLSDAQSSAMDTYDWARQGGGQQSSQPFDAVYGMAGANPYTSQINNLYGQANPSLSGYTSAANGLGSPSAAYNLSSMASGAQIGNSNPYIMDALGTAATKAKDAVNMSAAGAGRYGSAVHQGELAEKVGDIYSRGLTGQVNQDTANMMAANNQIDQSVLGYSANQLNALGGLSNAYNQQFGNNLAAATGSDNSYQNAMSQMLNAATGSNNVNQQNFSNALTGANSMFAGGQTGFGNMGGAYELAMQPGNTMRDIGAQYENLNTNVLNDQYRVWQETQSAPRQTVEWLNSIYGGGGSLGGQSTSTATAPQTNWGQTALGYGLASLFGF